MRSIELKLFRSALSMGKIQYVNFDQNGKWSLRLYVRVTRASHSVWAENITNAWLPIQTYGITSKGLGLVPKGQILSFDPFCVQTFLKIIYLKGFILVLGNNIISGRSEYTLMQWAKQGAGVSSWNDAHAWCHERWIIIIDDNRNQSFQNYSIISD